MISFKHKQVFNHSRQGFTLIELLVVIVLISIMLGVGSAFLTHLDRRLILRTSTGQITTLLRAARALSLREKTVVATKINGDTGHLQVWGNRLAGFWHFQDLVTTGANGINARVTNCKLTSGKVGKSLQFYYSRSQVDCGFLSKFNLRDGFHLSLWIYPHRFTGSEPQTIIKLGSLYTLGLNPDQSLYLQSGSKRSNIAHYLPLYRWVLLEITDDTTNVTVFADYIAREKFHSQQYPADMEREILLLGSAFQGKLDELKLSSRILVENFSLSERVLIKHGPLEIIFDTRGHLHPLHHSGSEKIILESLVVGKAKQASITISRIGTIEFAVP